MEKDALNAGAAQLLYFFLLHACKSQLFQYLTSCSQDCQHGPL